MEIKLARKCDDGYECFEVFGDITANAWAQHAVDPLKSQGGDDIYTKKIMLNMSKALHVDSTGIEWLLTCQKRFQQQGGKLVLHSVTPSTQRLFQMMRLHLILNISTNEDSAKSLFVGEPA